VTLLLPAAFLHAAMEVVLAASEAVDIEVV
jgi:hypothetical protein